MAKKKKDGKDEEKSSEAGGEASETEAKKSGEEGEGENKLADDEGKKDSEKGKTKAGEAKIKPIYKDSDKQSMYDELRADGKTDNQARQIVTLKSR